MIKSSPALKSLLSDTPAVGMRTSVRTKTIYSFLKETLHDRGHGYGRAGSTPSEQVVRVLESIADLASLSYQEDEHVHILEDIYRLAIGTGKFQRLGRCWPYLGFDGEDPVPSIEAAGILSLFNLAYFLEHHREVSLDMIRKCSNGVGSKQYPWATVGMNITRSLSVFFEIIDRQTGSVVNLQNSIPSFTRGRKWEFMLSEHCFSRLYCCMFVMFDSIFHELDSTDVSKVLQLTETRFFHLFDIKSSIEEIEAAVDIIPEWKRT